MQVDIFIDVRRTDNLYSNLIQKIQQLDRQHQIDSISNLEFRMIAQRTVQFKKMKLGAQESFLEGRLVCIQLIINCFPYQ
jgi:hypothetical protein